MIERLSMQTEYSAMEASIHIARYLLAKDFVAGKSVLDVACGEGYGSYLLKQWGAKSVVGVDIDSGSIELAKSLFNADDLEFYSSNAEDLVFIESESFDIVVSFETIEHVDDPTKYLHEIKRVVKDDGLLIISCPNDHYYYPSSAVSNPFHKRKFTFEEFKELTQDVLGNVSSQCISGAVVGYMNCENQAKRKAVKTQLDMVQSIQSIQSIQISPNTPIEEENACYWVLLWDFSKEVRRLYDSTVSYVTDLKTAGQPLLDSVFFEKKLWESFEQQGVLGEIIRTQQIEAADHKMRFEDRETAYMALSNELEFHKQRNIEITEQLQKATLENGSLTERLSDIETAHTALSNELEFLKQNLIKGKSRKTKKKLSLSIKNRFMAIRSEKAKHRIWKFYSMLPCGIRSMIKKV